MPQGTPSKAAIRKYQLSIPQVYCVWVQVHGGNLHDGRRFAMKIQYPGVARSIESDVDNLMRLIKVANLLPKGLYIEQAAEVSHQPMITTMRIVMMLLPFCPQ